MANKDLAKLQGQWYKSNLLSQFYSENECYKLIDGEMAYSFRIISEEKKRGGNV